MSAVIRIKRHIDDEPLSAFLLNCKKRRTSDPETSVFQDDASGSSPKENDTGSTTQILKFVGTVTKVLCKFSFNRTRNKSYHYLITARRHNRSYLEDIQR